MQSNKQQRTKAEREFHITAWRQTKLSKVEYSKEHQISYQTFCGWFKKAELSKLTTSKFIPVEISTEQEELKIFATLRFSNQVTIELHQPVGAAFVKQLISCS